MNRRELVGALAGATLLGPNALYAQQVRKLARNLVWA